MLSPSENENPNMQLLFADISRLTAMPFPNLVYRLLAREPTRLEDCWSRVRSGLALVGASTLRRRFEQIQLAVKPTVKRPSEEHRPTRLLDVLDVYDSGNSCNAVLVPLLLSGSSGRLDSPLLQPPVIESLEERQELPSMLALDLMSDAARACCINIAQLVGAQGDAVPSLFLHLANDSALLAEVAAVLQVASSNNRLDDCFEAIVAEASRIVIEWPVPIAPLIDPGARALLAPFALSIARMLAVSAILRSALVSE